MTDKHPRAANDNARAILAWPTLERLAHRGDHRRLAALRFWRDLTSPTHLSMTAEPDELPGGDSGDPELYREVRPSVTEMLMALGWRVLGKERWHHTGQRVHTFDKGAPPVVEHRVRDGHSEISMGRLLFRNGKLVEYGRTAGDRPKLPAERLRNKKKYGSATGQRDPSAYVGAKPAIPSPLQVEGHRRPFSREPALPDFYDPLPRVVPTAEDRSGRYGVEAARTLLRQLGIDGSVPFDQLPFPATRCPPFALHGKQWTGGFTRGKGTGAVQALDAAASVRCNPGCIGEDRAATEMARAAEERRFRRLLREHAKVLDMAVTDSTAQAVGIARGLTQSSARKYGARIIDKALDRLVEIDPTIVRIRAANDNTENRKKEAA